MKLIFEGKEIPLGGGSGDSQFLVLSGKRYDNTTDLIADLNGTTMAILENVDFSSGVNGSTLLLIDEPILCGFDIGETKLTIYQIDGTCYEFTVPSESLIGTIDNKKLIQNSYSVTAFPLNDSIEISNVQQGLNYLAEHSSRIPYLENKTFDGPSGIMEYVGENGLIYLKNVTIQAYLGDDINTFTPTDVLVFEEETLVYIELSGPTLKIFYQSGHYQTIEAVMDVGVFVGLPQDVSYFQNGSEVEYFPSDGDWELSSYNVSVALDSLREVTKTPISDSVINSILKGEYDAVS